MKAQSTLRLALSLACLLSLGGCENTAPPTAAAARPFVFPTGLGTFWHYEITMDATVDTFGGYYAPCNYDDLELSYVRRDTVTASITGIDTIAATGEAASRMEYSKWLGDVGWYLDRLWITGASSSASEPMLFWAVLWESRPALVFQRPLDEGSSWLCSDCRFMSLPDYQQYSVEYVPVLRTRAGIFTGVYKVSHTYSCGDECGGLMTWWLKSNVGIVRLTQSLSAGGSPCLTYYSDATWELTEYWISR